MCLRLSPEDARQDGDAQDVDAKALDEEEHQRADRPAGAERREEVRVDPHHGGVARQQRLEPLEDCEVDDRRERGAAPERAVAAEQHRVAEREKQAREVHHEAAAREGDDHREQDGRHDAHGARGVDVVAQRGDAQRRVVGDP